MMRETTCTETGPEWITGETQTKWSKPLTRMSSLRLIIHSEKAGKLQPCAGEQNRATTKMWTPRAESARRQQRTREKKTAAATQQNPMGSISQSNKTNLGTGREQAQRRRSQRRGLRLLLPVNVVKEQNSSKLLRSSTTQWQVSTRKQTAMGTPDSKPTLLSPAAVAAAAPAAAGSCAPQRPPIARRSAPPRPLPAAEDRRNKTISKDEHENRTRSCMTSATNSAQTDSINPQARDAATDEWD